MEKEIGIQWYELAEFGYYGRKTETDEPISHFGQLPVVMDQVKIWCEKRPHLRSRQISTPCKDHDGLYVLHMGQLSNFGDYVLIILEAHKNGKKGTLYINEDAELSAKNLKPKTTKAPVGHIGGIPYYYWVVPELNKYAAIKIDYRINKTALETALESFLAFHAPSVKFVEVTKKGQTTKAKKIYVNPNETDNPAGANETSENGEPLIKKKAQPPAYFPRVRSKLARIDTKQSSLVQRRSSIKEYIIKATVDQTRGSDKLLVRLINKIHPIVPKTKDIITMEVSIRATPSEEDLKELFELHDNDDAVKNNIGFVLENDSPVWLDSSRNYSVHKCSLEYLWKGDRGIPGIVDLGSLAQAVEENRKEFLS